MGLFVTISLRKINQDNLNERDDYGEPFSEQQYRHGSCYISLFKYKSFGQEKRYRDLRKDLKINSTKFEISFIEISALGFVPTSIKALKKRVRASE